MKIHAYCRNPEKPKLLAAWELTPDLVSDAARIEYTLNMLSLETEAQYPGKYRGPMLILFTMPLAPEKELVDQVKAENSPTPPEEPSRA